MPDKYNLLLTTFRFIKLFELVDKLTSIMYFPNRFYFSILTGVNMSFFFNFPHFSDSNNILTVYYNTSDDTGIIKRNYFLRSKDFITIKIIFKRITARLL